MIKFTRRKHPPRLDWEPTTHLPDLSAAKFISLDTETKDEGLNQKLGPGGVRGMGYILGISVAVDGWSGYINLRHPDSENWSVPMVKRWFKDFMCDGQMKIGANILYDLEWLRAEGFPITGPFYDVQHVEALLDETLGRYNLDSLMKRYLPDRFQKATGDIDTLVERRIGKYKGDPRAYLWRLPVEDVGPYAEMDAIGPLMIMPKQMKRVYEEELEQVTSLESRLIPLLLDMRFRGVRVDVDALEGTVIKLRRRSKREQKKMDTLAGMQVNVNANASVAAALDAAGITYPRTKKTKVPSFVKDWLEHHPSELVQQVRKVRQVNTTIGLFIEGGIEKYLHNGRIYGNINQLRTDKGGAKSGRFSYSNPNLQQQPSRDPILAPLIRSLFVPEEGEEWWKNDWSQIEFRLIVHRAVLMGLPKADEAQTAYINNPATDFHQWAADLLNIPRKRAKDISFGLAYNMGKKLLIHSLGLSMQEGEALYSQYHHEVPFVSQLSKKLANKAQKIGFIKTLLGRRRRFNLWEPRHNYKMDPEYKTPLPSREEAMEVYGPRVVRAHTYRAMNGDIQGSAADIMKKAMVDCYESGVFIVLGTPSITVHDELDGSKPITKDADDALREAKHIMENCVKLEVPIYVDCETGKDWWNVKLFKN